MDDARRDDITQVLAEVTGGDRAAAARLIDLVYEELRALAGSYFRGRAAAHTLQPTALVHEAFVKLVDRTGLEFKDRDHFFAVSAVVMRGILADYARRRQTAKRGGGWKRLTLSDADMPARGDDIDVLALDEALTRLAALSPRQARIVEYRFFSGMTVDTIGSVLGVSKSTVEEDWRMARAWLKVEIAKGTA